LDFGLAEKMVIRGVARGLDVELHQVMKINQNFGDLGQTAEMISRDKKTIDSEISNGISIHQLYQKLKELAETTGLGSQELKVDRLAQLIKQSLPLESKYLIRMVLSKMRLGFSDKTILDALSVMEGGTKQARESLEQAYQIFPDIGVIAYLARKHGVYKVINHVKNKVGVPVIPALAQRLKSADEMIEKMGKVMVEPKYDGTRVQIHFSKKNEFVSSKYDMPAGKAGVRSTEQMNASNSAPRTEYFIKTFARSLEENSAMFPALSEVHKQLSVESIVLDSEAVGFDPATGKLRPFQETITRKRKYGVEALSKSIPVKFFCFDVLYLNGQSLLDKPLYQRREILESVITSGEVLVVDPMIVTDSADELRRFHKQQLDEGLEGALVKKYDGVYQPGRSGWNWVKFKEVENAQGKLKDTIDGIVMGYYRGRGKRSNFGIGAFLMGIWDEKKSEYVTLAKIGTGLSDDQWRELKKRVDENFSIDKPQGYQVSSGLIPDIWADPTIVVEVAADEITKSPMHSAGWGLRFPRLVKFRDDKSSSQVTQTGELVSL